MYILRWLVWLCHISPHYLVNGAFSGGNNLLNIPYILESNPRRNLIRTSFCRFLKRKKKKSYSRF